MMYVIDRHYDSKYITSSGIIYEMPRDEYMGEPHPNSPQNYLFDLTGNDVTYTLDIRVTCVEGLVYAHHDIRDYWGIVRVYKNLTPREFDTDVLTAIVKGFNDRQEYIYVPEEVAGVYSSLMDSFMSELAAVNTQ